MRPSSYEIRVVVTLQAHVDGPHPEEAVVNAAIQAIENAVRQAASRSPGTSGSGARSSRDGSG